MDAPVPHPGPLIRALRARAGLSLEALAEAAKSTAATLSRIENEKQRPSPATLQGLARALGVDTGPLMSGDMTVLDYDPTAPDPEPPEEPPARGGAGVYESRPIAGYLDGAGIVRGNITIDLIDRPSGKSGDYLRKHAARTPRGDDAVPAEFVRIDAVPPGAELVRVESPVELRDEGHTIYAGYFLVVDRERQPESGRLVLAKQTISNPRKANRDPTALGPDVMLFRYHALGNTWALAPIDGGDGVGPGDGWMVVATVLYWRPL